MFNPKEGSGALIPATISEVDAGRLALLDSQLPPSFFEQLSQPMTGATVFYFKGLLADWVNHNPGLIDVLNPAPDRQPQADAEMLSRLPGLSYRLAFLPLEKIGWSVSPAPNPQLLPFGIIPMWYGVAPEVRLAEYFQAPLHDLLSAKAKKDLQELAILESTTPVQFPASSLSPAALEDLVRQAVPVKQDPYIFDPALALGLQLPANGQEIYIRALGLDELVRAQLEYLQLMHEQGFGSAALNCLNRVASATRSTAAKTLEFLAHYSGGSRVSWLVKPTYTLAMLANIWMIK